MSVLVRSFYYTPDASFCEESSYTLRAGFSEEFPLPSLPMPILVRSFYYTADTNFSEEFLSHSSY